LENVLIDKQVNWLAKDENQELIKDFEKIFVVGKDLKQTSFDENCASFCVDRNCDFLKICIVLHSYFENFPKITPKNPLESLILSK